MGSNSIIVRTRLSKRLISLLRVRANCLDVCKCLELLELESYRYHFTPITVVSETECNLFLIGFNKECVSILHKRVVFNKMYMHIYT